MYILGIESSCDDTSVALINATDGVFDIVSARTASQIDIHMQYGGVIPEIAGRRHADTIMPVIAEVMDTGGIDRPDVIAVTAGPGLITGLLVGVEVAKNLSYLWDVPVVRVNHIHGHVHSVLLPESDPPTPVSIVFPALCLVVSGGHTELLLMRDHTDFTLIGKTRDDAAGEAFDKAAKMLGMAYPGGPKISQEAATGNPAAIAFPRPMLKKDGYEFSFAGLKTAARYWLQEHATVRDQHYELRPRDRADFCASYEQAIVDVLVEKTLTAAQQHPIKTVILAGGVSANPKLRRTLERQLHDVTFYLPARAYAMDNGAMIAAAGYFLAQKELFTPWQDLFADPNWNAYE